MKRGRKKLDPYLKQSTIYQIKQGFTIQQLADSQQIGYTTMVNRLNTWGLKAPRAVSHYTPSQRDLDLIKMFNNGEMQATDVAKKFNISRERVRQILEKNRVDPAAAQTLRISKTTALIQEAMIKMPMATNNEVAELTGLPLSYITFRRKKMGISPDRTEFYNKRRKARFWSRVNITADPNECWDWTGPINKKLGYPWNAAIDGKNRAQVIAYTLTKGSPQHYVSTTCDNHLCVNPNHLEDVKYDKLMEKRARTYERNPALKANIGNYCRKYNDATVEYLKILKKTMTLPEVAKTANIPLWTVTNLLYKKRKNDNKKM